MNQEVAKPETWRAWLPGGVLVAIVLASAVGLVLQWPTIYYWKFNHVRDGLTALPEVTIVESWKHEDVTVETSWFTLQVRECPKIGLTFHQDQDWPALLQKASAVNVTWRDGIHSESATTILNGDDLKKLGCKGSGVAEILGNLERILGEADSRHVEKVPSQDSPSPRGDTTLDLVVLGNGRTSFF